METIIQISQFIMSLSLLIVLHELGHFIPAKLFKTKVEKFYLFFDWPFSLFKRKFGDTEYGVGILPLGGYVKIAGMIDESMDQEQLNKKPEEWEFRSKPTWQRLIIMVGGVTVNLILGFLIYMMILFVWGKTTLSNKDLTLGLEPSTVVQKIGFQSGDQIISVDGKKLDNILDINKYLFLRPIKSVDVKHLNGQTEQILIPENLGKKMFESGEMIAFSPAFAAIIDSVIPNSPASKAGFMPNDKILSINGLEVLKWSDFKEEMVDESRNITLVYERNMLKDTIQFASDDNGKIGVYPKIPSISFNNQKLGFTASIKEGFSYGYWTLSDYISQFKYVFTKKGATQLGGFGSIGSLFPTRWDWQIFWSMTALLSIILAFMNILPIPALDGGHVMFLIYEMIAGKPPSDQFLTRAQVVGMVLLFSLLIYANGMDLYRFISG
jgi:regulator of sigma E protease